MQIFIGILLLLFLVLWFMGAGFWGALISVLGCVAFGIMMMGMAG